MAQDSPDLVTQLASLRLTRDEPQRHRPRWPWALAVALLLATAVVAVALQGRFSTRAVALTPTLLIQPGQETALFVATGTVVAPVTAALSPRQPGRLLRLLVQEGDLVEPGQPLALLDPTDRTLALGQARAQLASAEAKLETAQVAVNGAQLRFDRAQRLARTGAGTTSAVEDAQIDLDNARAQTQVARADVQLARAQRQIAEASLDDMTLRASFRGVVLKALVQPGDYIATGFAQGVGGIQLADFSSLEVDAEVAEVNLGKLRVGMPVEVRLDALSAVGLPGTVFAVRPNVDPAKATAIAKVRLTDLAKGGEAPAAALPQGDQSAPQEVRLFPGMNGRVNFLSRAPDPKSLHAAPKLEVPASAVVQEGDRFSVLTVDASGRVSSVPVSLGGSDGDRAILTQGPAAGALVVAVPAGVRAGDRVKANQ